MTQLDQDVMSLSLALMQDLNTAVSLSVYIMLKYGDYDAITQHRVDPHNYLDVPSGIERFARDYQAVSFLRKYEGLPATRDLDHEARETFYKYEAQCFATNQRLKMILETPLTSRPFERAAVNLAQRVKMLLSSWLGPIPKSIKPRFGPGTCFEATGLGRAYTMGDKYNSPFVCTSSAADLVHHLVWRPNDRWVSHAARSHATPWLITEGNRFTTVPKDSTAKRGICIEAGMNIYLQLGVGEALCSRLARLGLEIRTGQDRHRLRVMNSSRTCTDATIDLSGASDTVAYQTVRLTFPPDWFELLASLRSPKTFINGRWVVLEKFSSMGNGFTFELETLLFLAIVCAATGCQPGEVSVYGDDIIVPRVKSAEALAALRFFGFTPNVRKTYTTGAFLESCGADYFAGFAVRPFFLKKKVESPAEWIVACNGITRRFKRAWNCAHRQIPSEARCYGPKLLGDLLIHTEDTSRWTYKWRNQIRWFRVWRPVLKRAIPLDRFGHRTALLLALSGQPSSGLIPRDWVSGYKRGRVALS